MESVAAEHIGPARADDATALAELAAATFPLACPPGVGAPDIAAFIDEHLSVRRFTEYLADDDHTILVARADDTLVGYAMLIRHPGALEVSKMYVRPTAHGSGIAAALMRAALDHADTHGFDTVWLGVNRNNTRAQSFYRKHGFTVTGERTFTLGGHLEHDYVMSRQH